MPFVITCPSCSAKLRTAAAIAMGRSVQCPKCKSSFAVDEDNIAESTDAKAETRPTSRPSAPPPARRAPAAAVDDNPFGGLDAPVTSSRRRDDDDEDDRPRSRRRDEDDEDDRPKSRKRVVDDDDDDDDRPRSRRRDEDDDDDRPSRHRDDDDHDRPRRLKKKRKKSNSTIWIIGGVSLLLLALLGFLLYYFVFSGSSNLDEEMLAFLPADTNMMAGVEVEELLGNEKAKTLFKKFSESGDGKEVMGKLKEAGLSENDVERILVGGKVDTEPKQPVIMKFDPKKPAPKAPPPPPKDPITFVVRFKSAVDKGKITGAFQATEKSKDGKTYYKAKKDEVGFVYFPSDKLMVVATQESLIEGILGKDAGKVVVSDEMKDAAKKLSKGHVWVVVGRSFFGEQLKQVDQMKGALPAEITNAASGMKSAGFYAKMDGDNLTIGGGLVCADSDTASKAADALNKKIDEAKKGDDPMLKAMKSNEDMKSIVEQVQNSISVSSSGSLVETSFSVNLTKIEAAMGGLLR